MRYKERISVDKLCKWAELAKSSLYYRVQLGQRGIMPSTHTIIGNNALVENNLVVDQIRAVLTMNYCIYGYRKITEELRDLEYLINKKRCIA